MEKWPLMELKELIAKKKTQELDYEDCHELASILAFDKNNEKQIVEFVNLLNDKGCSDDEVYNLALAFADSGKRLNCAHYFDCSADKHSAGLVSDAISLILMSVLPCVGITFTKTINKSYGTFSSFAQKLGAISGFVVSKDLNKTLERAKESGAFLYEGDESLYPASTNIYEVCKNNKLLIEPIVASTILANKIATGASSFVADIKMGEGSVYNSNQSVELAERIVRVAKKANIKAVAVVTDLNWPISASVGTKLELQEVKDLLEGSKDYGGSSLLTLAKEMVVCLLLLNKKASTRSEAGEMFDEAISSGKAYTRFKNIVETYGGSLVETNRKELLMDTAVSYITAKQSGYMYDIKLAELYSTSQELIGGSKTFDASAGVVLMCKEGDKIVEGQKIAKVLYSHENKRYFELHDRLLDSFEIRQEKPVINNLFYKVIV